MTVEKNPGEVKKEAPAKVEEEEKGKPATIAKPEVKEEVKQTLTCERKLDNSVFRKLGDWKEGEYKQT